MDKALDFVGLKDFVDGIFRVSNKRFTYELWEVIFDELQKKSDSADDPEDAGPRDRVHELERPTRARS